MTLFSARFSSVLFPRAVLVSALLVLFSQTVSSFTNQRRRIHGATPPLFLAEEEEDLVMTSGSSVQPAHSALRSPTMARKVRQRRTNRGRSVVVSSDKLRANHTQKKKKQKTTRSRHTQKDTDDCSLTTAIRQRRTNSSDLPYESTIKALRAYYSIHGDLVMPRRFPVPCEDPYPTEWYGLDLPSAVYNMEWWQKNVKEKPERVSALNKLGFVWERLQPAWNIVLEALITYHSFHGDASVPYKFVVPHGDKQWPRATWGIPLGNCVYRIRSRGDFLRGYNHASRRAQLEGLGFVWDVQEHRFQKFYVALRHYARLEGCGAFCSDGGRTKPLRVPSTFVVPTSDQWPEQFWTFPLGAKCTAVRQKQLYVKDRPDRQHILKDLGFRWSGNSSLGWLEVVHSAAIYSQLHNRNLDVPYQFVVPEPPQEPAHAAEDWPWPRHLWGLPLGQRLKEVRVRGAYLKGEDADARRRQLDALGFNWKPRRGRPPKAFMM